MKITLSVVALVLSSTFASAGALDNFKASFKDLIDTFPAHEQDGYRDTGCDPDQQVQVEGTNYFNNPTCPSVGGSASGFTGQLATYLVTPPDGNGGGSDDNGGGSEDPKDPIDDPKDPIDDPKDPIDDPKDNGHPKK